MEADRSRAGARGRASGVRRRDAAAAPGHVDRARPRPHRPDVARAGEAVSRGGGTMARVPAGARPRWGGGMTRNFHALASLGRRFALVAFAAGVALPIRSAAQTSPVSDDSVRAAVQRFYDWY